MENGEEHVEDIWQIFRNYILHIFALGTAPGTGSAMRGGPGSAKIEKSTWKICGKMTLDMFA